MFSRPVMSGWKPAPSSMRLDTRPFTVTRPSLGCSILVRSFRVVLFPQPFFPIRPTASPLRTWKLIPSSTVTSLCLVREGLMKRSFREAALSW